MFNAGDKPWGSTIVIPFNTFTSDDPSASVTITNLVAGDVEIHKDGGTTQRASDSGVTVSIDFDSITGNHIVSIDTSDNGDANFFIPGSSYQVRMEGTTVDAATINAWIGAFSLDQNAVAGRLVATYIATLASQVSFTLTAGSADNDAYNGCIAIITDRTTPAQKCLGLISDYTGATKTVTLAADPGIFTMAQYDNIEIIATSALANVKGVNGTLQTGNDNGADINTLLTRITAAIATKAEMDTAHALLATPANVATELGTYDGPTKTEMDTAHALLATVAKQDVIDGIVDAILVDTDTTIPALIAALNNLSAADVAAELATYDAPTKAEMDTAHALLATVAKQDVIDGIVDAILVDTGTTIPALIAALNNLSAADIATELATYDSPTKAEMDSAHALLATVAKQDVIDGIVDAILVDTGTTIPALIAALQDLSAADVAAELATYDAPTKAEMDAAHALLATAAVCSAARLAELDAVNLPSDIDDVKTVTDFVNKWILNKIVFTGTSMILYDDDGVTPLKTWTLSEGSLTVDGPYNRSAAS